MVDAQLTDQLDRYGRWLENSTSLGVRPELHVTTAVVRSDRSRRLLAVAAGVLLFAAGLTIARSLTDGNEQVVGTTPSDPSGALFMLPAPGSGFALDNGNAQTVVDSAGSTEVVIVGRRDGDWYRDLGLVQLTATRPAATENEFVTGTGKEVAGGWIQISIGPNQPERAAALLAATSLSAEGTLVFDAPVDEVVIDRGATTPDQPLAFTYAEVSSAGAPGEPIVVETAASPTSLVAPGLFNSAVSPFDVDGISGWRARRQDPSGEWNGIIWSATPSRVVAVSGVASFEDVLAVALSLQPADEADWREATGALD